MHQLENSIKSCVWKYLQMMRSSHLTRRVPHNERVIADTVGLLHVLHITVVVEMDDSHDVYR